MATPPRRVTRGSLARFAYDPNEGSSARKNTAMVSDIEDVLGDGRRGIKRTLATTAAAASAPRKRKRALAGAESTDNRDVTIAVKSEHLEAREVIATLGSPQVASASPVRRARKPARKALDPETNTEKVSPPSDWEEMYDVVKQMRLSGPAANAAVDTMGCERLALPTATPRDRRFQTLIALMLSSQTKDTTNAVAMRRLQTELPPYAAGAPKGLNLENILSVEPELLNELIWAVGFHNNKTKYIKQAAVILRDKWAGDIPDTIEGLTSLPGVGPKMAYLCLSAAWDRTEGIGVDVHVHRITNMWGWHKTKNPEETRLALQAWLPQDRWREINWLLVGLGQTVCGPVSKRCGECDLGLRGLCRAADRSKVNQGRKLLEVKMEEVKVEIGAGEGEEGVKGLKTENEELAEEKMLSEYTVKKEETICTWP